MRISLTNFPFFFLIDDSKDCKCGKDCKCCCCCGDSKKAVKKSCCSIKDETEDATCCVKVKATKSGVVVKCVCKPSKSTGKESSCCVLVDLTETTKNCKCCVACGGIYRVIIMFNISKKKVHKKFYGINFKFISVFRLFQGL